MELVIASANRHKISEFEQIMPSHITLISSAQLGITEDIPENETTLEGNALVKARYISEKTQRGCFADDTGLFVEALDGAPGVYSARYAQINGISSGDSSGDNIDLLLDKLSGSANRRAYFRTVIALIDHEGKKHLFEGKVEGTITTERRETGGFGYDPIFIPDGYDQTFAELTPQQKNQISHRGRASVRLLEYLNSLK